METKKQLSYSVGENTGRIINQITALSMWMSETTDLLNELNMLQGDICGSDFEEKDEFFNMFYKLKKRLTLYAGLSIGDQLDKITNFEPASNVTI